MRIMVTVATTVVGIMVGIIVAVMVTGGEVPPITTRIIVVIMVPIIRTMRIHTALIITGIMVRTVVHTTGIRVRIRTRMVTVMGITATISNIS